MKAPVLVRRSIGVALLLAFVSLAHADVIVRHGAPPGSAELNFDSLRGRDSWAQSFTTPANLTYELTTVSTRFGGAGEGSRSVDATLWPSVKRPDSVLPMPGAQVIADFGFENFSQANDFGNVTFTAPLGIILNPETTYWLVFTPAIEDRPGTWAPIVDYFYHDNNAAQIGTGTFGYRAVGYFGTADWDSHFGANIMTVEGTVTQTPEPATYTLFISGLFMLGCITNPQKRRTCDLLRFKR